MKKDMTQHTVLDSTLEPWGGVYRKGSDFPRFFLRDANGDIPHDNLDPLSVVCTVTFDVPEGFTMHPALRAENCHPLCPCILKKALEAKAALEFVHRPRD